MGHRPPTITQPAIARALREAKKQGCELIEIKPTGEVLIHINKIVPPTNMSNAYSIDDFPPLENEQEEYSTNKSCPPVDDIKF
ncbi:hypothetical protein [Bartonella vinsonii]|uniref:Uncharacterized protein n=1 Tax=Bartonella vinsonii TaxID=33047 RepID=A0A448V8N7_BARVI|nr:hypothetical protein [Bartonella vinsonii]VEJ46138.1 Uncharacterised protein [Bartonella vinsonii]